MSDFGLETILPINKVFVRGEKAIILEYITKRFITFHLGYKNDKYKTISIHEYQHYRKKVFDEGNPEDGMKLYVKMGGVSKLYLDNFVEPDDDYKID
tara:strand:- start:699 stop:989 length:291 start_codon:yes stop_codon:yes gene_type:complete